MKLYIRRIRLWWRNKFQRSTACDRSAHSVKRATFPNALHALFITWVLDTKADDFLRAIVDLSRDSGIYEFDSIIAGYEHTAPLHFDFLDTPIVLRYTIAGYPYELQPNNIQPSQCILYDLGNYSENMDVPDGYFERNVLETERLNLPMIYLVNGARHSQLDALKQKIHIAMPENLMIYDHSELDSFKEILIRLVEIATK